MKVLLIKDLKNVGKKGQIVEVSDGYGANFVIRQGYGKFLDEKAVKEYKAEQARLAQEDEANRLKAIEDAKKIEATVLVFKAKVGKNGTMIGSISTKAIVEKFKKDFDISLDKRKFIDHYQVNAFGTTKLRIELYKDVVATISVKVVEE